MKKTVAQAKGCVIGKLVKKLRETKKKLESSEVKPLKLTTRPAKLTEQMHYLKRTSNAELAILCLIANKTPAQVLTNPASDNDQQALAQLRSFKTIAERVEQIKSKFGLLDADDGWRSSIREIGKKKQKKTEKELREKRKAEQKDRQTKANESEVKRSEWLMENIAANDDAMKNEVNKLDEDKGAASGNKPVTDVKKAVKVAILSKSKVEIKKKIDVKVETKPAAKSYVLPKRQLDTFFVTDSGSAYMATSEFEERVQPLGPNDGLDRRQRRANKFGKSSAPSSREVPRIKRPDIATTKKQYSTLTRPNFVPTSKPVTAEVATDLHPSWAAKQKTKGLVAFQGRKMTFSDDAESTKPTSSGTRSSAPISIKSASKAEEASKLHPSWLAKQKLKPVISEFAGKKITFGD